MKTLICLFLMVMLFSCRKEERCIKCIVGKYSKEASMVYTVYMCGMDIVYTDGVLTLPQVDATGWDKVEIKCNE